MNLEMRGDKVVMNDYNMRVKEKKRKEDNELGTKVERN